MYNHEENKLLHELDEVSQELRLTKKALELACEDINVICQSYKTAEECKNCPFTCRHADLVESYMMKAREKIMSGGSHNYLAYKMDDELYDQAYVHYLSVDNPKEAIDARRDDPFEDKDISELVFGVACVVHALEWYKSGDICEEKYREVLAKFKKNYLQKAGKDNDA